MDKKKNKEGNYKCLNGLPHHDDDCGVKETAIDSVERGFHNKIADQLVGAANFIENLKFAPRGWNSLTGAGGYHKGSPFCGLAQLDIANVREAQDPFNLQPELGLVNSP